MTRVAFVSAVTVLGLLVSPAGAAPAHAADRRPPAARGYDQPYTGFAPANTRLREGVPADLGLDRRPIDSALAALRAYETRPGPAGVPLYPGSVAVVGSRGRIIARQASGDAVRYADGSRTELPPEQRVAATNDTIYDMASVTKLFTTILVMQEVERGRIDLDAPVAQYLPEFAAADKQTVTVRQLLTHTSGFEPFIPLWKLYSTREARLAGVLAHPLKTAPGRAYVYSDLNLITLGVLLERLNDTRLDSLLTQRVTRPLRMVDTGYNPPADKRDRVAATEFDATLGRGIVRGEVHDENAASLDGVAGHAGVFSTVDDLAILAQAMLDGGTYRGARILQADTVRDMLVNQIPEFPGDAHGLGVELDQTWYMGGLAGPATAGHTGFTGTSMVVDFAARSFAVLLTNRVHPTRNAGSINVARRALASGLADALPVRPRKGPTAWRAGQVDGVSATGTLPVAAPLTADAPPTRLTFATFVANDVGDPFVLERTTNGTDWTPLRAELREPGRTLRVTGDLGSTRGTRHWQRASATLPPGTTAVRWRHTTDEAIRGRGVYVDDVRLVSGRRVVLDTETRPDALRLDGWAPSAT